MYPSQWAVLEPGISDISYADELAELETLTKDCPAYLPAGQSGAQCSSYGVDVPLKCMIP